MNINMTSLIEHVINCMFINDAIIAKISMISRVMLSERIASI